MLAKHKVMVFVDLFHSTLHLFLKLDNGPFSISRNIFIIDLHYHIHHCRYFALQEGQEVRIIMKLLEWNLANRINLEEIMDKIGLDIIKFHRLVYQKGE
jgi:hypothetical protein